MAPDEISRNRFDVWMAASAYTNEAFGEVVGVSRESVRLYRLAYDDPNRSLPKPPVMARIEQATGGEVSPRDFYPVQARTDAASASEAVGS